MKSLIKVCLITLIILSLSGCSKNVYIKMDGDYKLDMLGNKMFDVWGKER